MIEIRREGVMMEVDTMACFSQACSKKPLHAIFVSVKTDNVMADCKF